MSTYDQISNPIFRKACETAEQVLQAVVKAEEWGDANSKKGFLNGLAFRFINAAKYTAEELEAHSDKVDERLNNAVKMTDYGRAQYWHAYIQGWGVACVMVSAAMEDGIEVDESEESSQ